MANPPNRYEDSPEFTAWYNQAINRPGHSPAEIAEAIRRLEEMMQPAAHYAALAAQQRAGFVLFPEQGIAVDVPVPNADRSVDPNQRPVRSEPPGMIVLSFVPLGDPEYDPCYRLASRQWDGRPLPAPTIPVPVGYPDRMEDYVLQFTFNLQEPVTHLMTTVRHIEWSPERRARGIVVFVGQDITTEPVDECEAILEQHVRSHFREQRLVFHCVVPDLSPLLDTPIHRLNALTPFGFQCMDPGTNSRFEMDDPQDLGSITATFYGSRVILSSYTGVMVEPVCARMYQAGFFERESHHVRCFSGRE